MKNLYTQKVVPFAFFCFLSMFSFTAFGQVGIGTTDPKSALDVNGALSLREGPALSLGNGNNDVSLGATVYSQYRITGPSNDFYIRNIAPQQNADGQIITLINTTNFPMTIKHEAGPGSFLERRIYCPSGIDLVLDGQNSTVTLQYNTSLQRWVVVSYADVGGYGRNVLNSIGTTDINTNSDSFDPMDDMSITFTPKHSVVYVNFSASGTMDKGSDSETQGYAAFQLMRGSTSVAATTTLATDRSFLGSACSGDAFYDSGGVSGDYGNNETIKTTFTADPGERIYASFSAFQTESGYDGLMVYDGPDDSFPLIDSGSRYGRPACPNGAFTGTGIYSAQGLTFTSTQVDGALTFVFTSDSFVTRSGWEACVTSSVAPPPAGYSLDTAWNASFVMYPVTVTPGVPNTISINWLRDGLVDPVELAKTLRNNVSSNADRSHRSITIFD